MQQGTKRHILGETVVEIGVLTEEQKYQWTEDGYLVLKGVLSAEEIEKLTTVVDQMDEKHREQLSANSSQDESDVKPYDGLNKLNIIEDNDIFVELMDHPVTFSIVLELLGPFIQLGMSQAMIRPPNPENKGLAHALHPDGGQAMQHIRVDNNSLPLQIKIQYFLTPLAAPERGNFTIVPGSHHRSFPAAQLGNAENPHNAEAVQLCVEAGDAAVFPHALWHGAASNRSNYARKTLIYCYNHHCFRAYDYREVSPKLLERCTPRQRRLLGDIGEWQPGSYFYSPADQEAVMTGHTESKT